MIARESHAKSAGGNRVRQWRQNLSMRCDCGQAVPFYGWPVPLKAAE